MSSTNGYQKTPVLIVGAGPAGLAAAIAFKKARPQADVCVIDKAAELGNHNLSGAVLEAESVHRLLNLTGLNWRDTPEAKELLAHKIEDDQILFLPGKRMALPITFFIRLARMLNLSLAQMSHLGDYIVSVSRLTRWLGKIARELGVEVYNGFAAVGINWDAAKGRATGVRLIAQGLDREGKEQPNYLPEETIEADVIILAEGCDGLLTEQFVELAGLKRAGAPLFSVGVKELIRVSPEQYQRFGDHRVIHAMGYPLWVPVRGPSMFGGGIAYSYGDNTIAVGMIAGLDWKDRDFNPQDALVHFKCHRAIRKYIEGGKVIEAGAKMIPEGGERAIPRDPATGSIGRSNVLIVGDSAGFVNMLKIKGLHNAIDSGILAGQAAAQAQKTPDKTAQKYTEMVGESPVFGEMREARNFRQTIARFGNTLGLPLSVFSSKLPEYAVERDSQAMRGSHYRFKGNKEFDKMTFIALAHTHHREDQPCHLKLRDPSVCETRCREAFGQPCVTFCPAGVYECVHGQLAPVNASNCLHCKTCQRKCPLDNIIWTAPEGTGGPRYKGM
jgi:electron-transferring-flavoprotein dehydrogenase